MLMCGIVNEMNQSALCCESELMKPKLIYLHYLHEQWQALCYMCRLVLHTYDFETQQSDGAVSRYRNKQTPKWKRHIH